MRRHRDIEIATERKTERQIFFEVPMARDPPDTETTSSMSSISTKRSKG